MNVIINDLMLLSIEEKIDDKGNPAHAKDGAPIMRARAIQTTTAEPITFTAEQALLADIKPKTDFSMTAKMGVFNGRPWYRAVDIAEIINGNEIVLDRLEVEQW